MLEFREISINDKFWIDTLLAESDFMGCEYSFANNLAWRRLYNTKVCRYKDFYISCNYEDGKPYYTFPSGKGNYDELFSELQNYSKSLGAPLKFGGVNDDMLLMLENKYHGSLLVETSEDNFDYIYNSKDLINLEGKKYHNKRNHLAKLNGLDWCFEEITPENFNECIEFSAKLYNNKNNFDDFSYIVEQFVINTFFENFSFLNLFGGIIRVNGNIEAFSIGEKLNSNTLCVHIEKANPLITGTYVAINNEFCKRFATNFEFVNREEDLGIEGLRKAKKSYYPCFMLKKHNVTFKEGVIL